MRMWIVRFDCGYRDKRLDQWAFCVKKELEMRAQRSPARKRGGQEISRYREDPKGEEESVCVGVFALQLQRPVVGYF